MDEFSEEDRQELEQMKRAGAEKRDMSLAGVRGELATPMPPYERTAALVTLYCEDGGALGYYRDETRTASPKVRRMRS